MDQQPDAPGKQHSTQATWLFSVPLNLALGVLALAPLVSTLVGIHAVAHELGWADLSMVDSDEHEVVILVCAFSWLVFAPTAYGLNRLVLRRSAMPGRRYWLLAGVLLIVPYLVVCQSNGAIVW